MTFWRRSNPALFSFLHLCENVRVTIVEKKTEFNKVLFRWHRGHYRLMPWRPKTRDARTRLDPYCVLVSEIMLQQTQVERVRTKYAEFLKKFPTVKVLAAASLGDVLRAWSGLGYNRRAKYLHECAKKIVNAHGGRFPNTYSELLALPGIGMSTAGGLLAFSFGEDTPMIDTNIRRILVRVFFKKIPTDKSLYTFAQSLIPKGGGRAWNYAMLDLGAALCTARNHSPKCPLTKLHGKVVDFVYKKPQKKFKDSRRYYRGQVFRLIGEVSECTTAHIAKFLKLPKEEVMLILDDLIKEKMLFKNGSKISLPQ